MPIDKKRQMISELLPEFGFVAPSWTKPKKPAQ
jgi:hypothetical protein